MLFQNVHDGGTYQTLSCWEFMLAQERFHLRRIFPLEESIQTRSRGAQLLLLDGGFQKQPLLLDCAIHQYQYQVRREVCDGQDLKMLQTSLAGAWRGHDRRAVQQTRHHRSCQAHPLIELILYLVELVANLALFAERERRLLHKMFYKVAVPQIGGDTPCRSMRLINQVRLFQPGQLVAHGGGAEIQSV